MDSLGDRIKGYEQVSRHTLVKRMPVVIRLDGRAFHTLTRKMDKPFDFDFQSSMIAAAYDLMCEIQGSKIAYIQSDEVSIVMTDYDDINSQGWFNYNQSKIISIAASIMSMRFADYMKFPSDKCEVFDCRAFNVPVNDITNTLLWRAKDWQRNSLQMYARSFFSHRELIGKKTADMHNMLYEIGKNWTTDVSNVNKNGTFLVRRNGMLDFRYDILPNYEAINELVDGLI